MKVLVVSEYFFPTIRGGGQVNLDLLTKYLAKNAIQVHVLTSHQPGLKVEEQKDQVQIHRFLKSAKNAQGLYNNIIRSTLFPRSVVNQVRKIVTSTKVDLIHLTGSSVIAARFLKDLGIPLIATVESYPALCPKGDRIYHGKEECTLVCSKEEFKVCQRKCDYIGKSKNKWYIKYNPLALNKIYSHYQYLQESLRYCHCIAISSYIKKLLASHKIQSSVIGNGLEIKRFWQQNNEEGKIKNRKPKILYLGALIESKGPHILLDAIQDIECHVDIYGEGILKEELEKMIKASCLDATIHQPVSYDNIPQVYANSDLVIFPSIWPEPFGRIAIEAQAAGKVVIASRIGGIQETIKDQETGFLVQPGSSQQLKEAIKMVIESTPLRKKIEERAVKVAEQYDITQISESLIDFYKQVLKNKKR